MLYKYRALDTQGVLIKGYIQSASRKTAYTHLQLKALDVFSLQSCWMIKRYHRETAVFFLYLSYALDAGHPLASSMTMLQSLFRGFFQQLLQDLHEKLRHGMPLSEACRTYPNLFPSMVLALLHLGEQSGQFSYVCLQAWDYLKTSNTHRKKLWSSLAYPLINLAFLMVATIVLTKNMLPEVIGILNDLQLPWPLATRILFFFSNASSYLHAWTLGLIFVFFALRGLWERYLKWNIFGRILLPFHYLHFFSGLSLLMREKMTLLQALTVVCEGHYPAYVKTLFRGVLDSIQQGKKFYVSLEHFPYFSRFYLYLIQAGESTGHQLKSLQTAVSLMEQQANEQRSRLSIWSFPAAMILVGLCFWVVMEGTILPLYTHMNKGVHAV